MRHITENQLLELVEERIEAPARAQLMKHVAVCGPCGERVADALRSDDDFVEDIRQGAAGNGRTPLGTPRSCHSAWSPPERFDEFRIERRLGRGGMGTVFLAYDARLDRKVAIKFITVRDADRALQEQFIREGQALAQITHRNVVTVYRVAEVDDHPYLAYEYVAGQSLAERKLPLRWQEVGRLGLLLGRGLAAVHGRGLIHRDIKPSNVLVDEAGEVKLVDFGLAVLEDAGGDENTLPLAGTPQYMAPEARHHEPASYRSDIFSFGALLYELCTGEPAVELPAHWSWSRSSPQLPHPHADLDDPAEVAAQARRIAKLREVPNLDPELGQIIERCLAPEPEARFASGELLRLALERVVGGYVRSPLAADNPYRGLLPFDAEHQALFFGRDREVLAILDQLRHQRVVLLAGDSGVGKSSLCNAGLLPLIARGALGETRQMTCVRLVPGGRPLDALAQALGPPMDVLGLDAAAVREGLERDPAALGRRWQQTMGNMGGLLVLIDQAEELVTVSDAEQARAFGRALEALQPEGSAVGALQTLVVVRGDYLTRLAERLGLGQTLGSTLYLLGRLAPEEIREAVVGPARARGVVFETGALIDTLVDSAGESTGGLPLLQFALAELWHARDPVRGCIPAAALDRMGGVGGALARHADAVMGRLSAAQQQAASRLLLRLTTRAETRIRRREDELDLDADARVALTVLVEGRLVVATRDERGDTSYELAHEALVSSWPALRHWRELHIGRAALQERLLRAAVEWERLGKPVENLWNQRQLAELGDLDHGSLGPREREFLARSGRRVRRQRWARLALPLAAVMLVLVVYGGLRFHAYRGLRRQVMDARKRAAARSTQARKQLRQAQHRRDRALAQFDGALVGGQRLPAREARQEIWNKATAEWTRAVAELRSADALFVEAEGTLEEALALDAGDATARAALADVLCERLQLGRQLPGYERTNDTTRRLALVDDVDRCQQKQPKPAQVSITTEPAGALVQIDRYTDDGRGNRRLEPLPATKTTPVVGLSLSPGSYLLTLTQPGLGSKQSPVRQPLVLEPGQERQLEVQLPKAVPRDMVYVPPGCFLFGSNDFEPIRKFILSPPQHLRCIEAGYLIGETEVTLGEWITYLDSLPSSAPARHLLDTPFVDIGGGVGLRYAAVAGTWEFSYTRESGQRPELLARAGEPVHYPRRDIHATADWRRFPLVGIAYKDFTGYLDWLDHSGRLPGARLCSEYEWERAARGADDRLYPHGDTLQRFEANYEETHGESILQSYGLDEVGAHPQSASPFGLQDTVGNVWEVVAPIAIEPAPLTIRGGSYNYPAELLRTMWRQEYQLDSRSVTVGFRVCAPLQGVGR